MSSLFSNLASDSVPRIRLLSKFADSEYEKVDRLLELREHAVVRLKATEKEIAAAKAEAAEGGEEEDESDAEVWYLRRLDGGLFTLQTVDYILAWICMEDDGVRAPAHSLNLLLSPRTNFLASHVAATRASSSDLPSPLLIQIRAHVQFMLARKDMSLKDIVKVLIEFYENVGDEAAESASADPDAPTQRMILQGLIQFLDAC